MRNADLCRVYWGSHGCGLPRGHQGDHLCSCCDCDGPPHNPGCVAGPPYYGPDTRFYGEDAEALGLPLDTQSTFAALDKATRDDIPLP